MGPTPIQVVKIPRRVVVIYFFHSKYAKYMILLLVTVHSSASCRGRPTGPQNDSKHNVHSKQSSITKKKKVDRGQTTLIPSADGFHNAVNDCFKKLGSLLSASRSK